MATNTLKDIVTGTIVRPPRMVLLGREKVGKSTFAAGAPSPIFIPIIGEEGLDAIDAPKFPTAGSFAEALDALRALHREDHEYETIIIDSASALEPLIWQQCCSENRWSSIEAPGYGKGYVECLKQWRQVLDALDHLRRDKRMTAIIIGHTKVKMVNDPLTDPYDGYVFDVHDRAMNLTYRWADSILFASRKTFVKTTTGSFGKTTSHAVGTDDPVLLTRARPGHPGGGRGVYGQLPYELPLTWNAFQSAINNARSKQCS